MNNSLSEDYFQWSASQIGVENGSQEKTYTDLLSIMYEKEYDDRALIPNDHNRLADGLDLRREFCEERNIRAAPVGPCSFLEVLIGLSRRLAFIAGGDVRNWAWQLITNLELHRKPDPLTPRKASKVHDILDDCIGRSYRPDGLGGFFPLAWPDEDQTKVELWYQMAAYIDEQYSE